MSRDGSGRYQGGTSGNPGGLPAFVRSVRLLAGQKAPRALIRLAEMMEDSDMRVALPACLAILDRAGVRPVDILVNLGHRDPVRNLLDETPEIEPAELAQLIMKPERILGGSATGQPKRDAISARRGPEELGSET
jgi:hypothetical protein